MTPMLAFGWHPLLSAAPLLADAGGVILFLLFLAGAFLNFLFKKGGLIDLLRQQSKEPPPPAPGGGSRAGSRPPPANAEEARMRKLLEALGQAGRGGAQPPLSPFPGSAGKSGPPRGPLPPDFLPPVLPPPLPQSSKEQRKRERRREESVGPDQLPPVPRAPAVPAAPGSLADRLPRALPALPALPANAVTRGSRDAAALRELLREPGGGRLRQAILLREVLGPPRGLSERIGPTQ